MGRKITYIEIEEEGRDKGKVYKITEASAVQADKWGIRAMLALNRNGANIPDEIAQMGLIGILAIGVHKLRGVLWEDLEPLLDEMLTCVEICPTPSARNVVRQLWADPNDIEEVSTLSMLRYEVFKLHTGFTKPVAPLNSQDGQAGEGANPSAIQTPLPS